MARLRRPVHRWYEELGLSRNPFDDRAMVPYWDTERARLLGEVLLATPSSPAVLAVTGAAGTGKSVMREAALEHLEGDAIALGIRAHVFMDPSTLTRQLWEEFATKSGVTYRETGSLRELGQMIAATLKQGQSVSILVDDADELTDDCLDLLLSLAASLSRRSLRLVLFGRAEIGSRLRGHARAAHVQLEAMTRLDAADVEAYLAERLSFAAADGAHPPVLTESELAHISRRSRGVPGRLDKEAQKVLRARVRGGGSSLRRPSHRRGWRRLTHWLGSRMALGASAGGLLTVLAWASIGGYLPSMSPSLASGGSAEAAIPAAATTTIEEEAPVVSAAPAAASGTVSRRDPNPVTTGLGVEARPTLDPTPSPAPDPITMPGGTSLPSAATVSIRVAAAPRDTATQASQPDPRTAAPTEPTGSALPSPAGTSADAITARPDRSVADTDAASSDAENRPATVAGTEPRDASVSDDAIARTGATEDTSALPPPASSAPTRLIEDPSPADALVATRDQVTTDAVTATTPPLDEPAPQAVAATRADDSVTDPSTSTAPAPAARIAPDDSAPAGPAAAPVADTPGNGPEADEIPAATDVLAVAAQAIAQREAPPATDFAEEQTASTPPIELTGAPVADSELEAGGQQAPDTREAASTDSGSPNSDAPLPPALAESEPPPAATAAATESDAIDETAGGPTEEIVVEGEADTPQRPNLLFRIASLFGNRDDGEVSVEAAEVGEDSEAAQEPADRTEARGEATTGERTLAATPEPAGGAAPVSTSIADTQFPEQPSAPPASLLATTATPPTPTEANSAPARIVDEPIVPRQPSGAASTTAPTPLALRPQRSTLLAAQGLDPDANGTSVPVATPSPSPAATTSTGGLGGEREILGMPGDALVIQVMVLSSATRAAVWLAEQRGTGTYAAYQRGTGPEPAWVILQGPYSDSGRAEVAARDFQARTGVLNPWIRSVADVQDEIRRRSVN